MMKENNPMSSAPPFNSEDRFLGKKTDYKFAYDKTLLQPIPRSIERKKIGVDKESIVLPFCGKDVWNCYEFSTLTNNGIPVVGIAKIIYDCSSPNLIESKSLKLYLNGFSMTNTGRTERECLQNCEHYIQRDLSDSISQYVAVTIFPQSTWEMHHYTGISFVDLDDLVKQDSTLVCKTYKEDPTILKLNLTNLSTPIEELYRSSAVRSCCKITHQPDFGTYFIRYRGKNTIQPSSLFQYLVSFRDEWHFHEECAELTFKRLFDILQPIQLCVACFYTRRGGIDINVFRSTDNDYLDTHFNYYLNEYNQSYKQARQ